MSSVCSSASSLRYKVVADLRPSFLTQMFMLDGLPVRSQRTRAALPGPESWAPLLGPAVLALAALRCHLVCHSRRSHRTHWAPWLAQAEQQQEPRITQRTGPPLVSGLGSPDQGTWGHKNATSSLASSSLSPPLRLSQKSRQLPGGAELGEVARLPSASRCRHRAWE